MRVLGMVIVGLVLGGTASAQTMKPADLIGQWAKSGEKVPAFAFLDDSTVVVAQAIRLGSDQDFGQELPAVEAIARWRLAGDTLVVSDFKMAFLQESGNLIPLPMDHLEALSRTVKLEGPVLTLTALEADAKPRVYTRLDAATP
jgi:hypothetical protein